MPAAARYFTVLFSICVATWKEHFFPLHFFSPSIATLEQLLLWDPAVAVWLCFIKRDEIGCWGKKKMPKKKLPTKSTNSQLWFYVRMLSKTFQRWTCCKYRLIISTLTSLCIQFFFSNWKPALLGWRMCHFFAVRNSWVAFESTLDHYPFVLWALSDARFCSTCLSLSKNIALYTSHFILLPLSAVRSSVLSSAGNHTYLCHNTSTIFDRYAVDHDPVQLLRHNFLHTGFICPENFLCLNCEGSFRAFQAIFLFFSEASGLCFVINPECVSIH